MRPYKLTPEKHDELMNRFSEYLKTLCMTQRQISFSHQIPDVKSKDKVSVIFTMKAYIKMRDLVDRYASEVGWFGFIDKVGDLEYRVTDICVYPQLVTGATVKETNEPWDDDMPIEQIKRRHFHGHSHVNMAPMPSVTDLKHRDDQVSLVRSDSFYFFMIVNKSCAWTATLFDLAGNTVYETDDILIDVDLGDGETLSDFVVEARHRIRASTPDALKKMMDERNPLENTASAPVVVTTTNLGQSAWLPKPAQPKKSKKSKKKRIKGASSPSQSSFLETIDDDELEYLENIASMSPDYFDDALGFVSDTPMHVNKAVLSMMR